MADFTSKMVSLMAAMRRERNGAVADDMRFYGAPYGLNYGVSLPTVRAIARGEEKDHEFAKFLLCQQVRELRLAAFHLAEPDKITREEFDLWGGAIINSEAAEEIAFALLRHTPALNELFDEWVAGSHPLWVYAVMMAGARVMEPRKEWIEKCWSAVVRFDAQAAETTSTPAAEGEITPAVSAHLVEVGAVALLSNIGLKSEENRQAIIDLVSSSERLKSSTLVYDELSWRLDTEF